MCDKLPFDGFGGYREANGILSDKVGSDVGERVVSMMKSYCFLFFVIMAWAMLYAMRM